MERNKTLAERTAQNARHTPRRPHRDTAGHVRTHPRRMREMVKTEVTT